MKAVIQRVKKAKVKIGGKKYSEIGPGFLIFLGVTKDDSSQDAQFLVDKIVNLRAMSDREQRMNLSLLETKGEVLIVSQFTLCANLSKGRRPSFGPAADPDKAKSLYQYFVQRFEQTGLAVKTGGFGAMMDVFLINDGPVTFILDSKVN
jgi:D-tyrosyl-tRNA(Tyr) deacylase